MIVREIKTNTDETLKDFDYFNDYDDTLRWAKRNCEEVVPRLESGFKGWLKWKWGWK